MSSRISTRKGDNKKRAQKHQNITAWKPNKGSKKTKEINSLPIYGLCTRCHDQIEWRKKYRKYKPLTTPKRCTSCSEKTIKEAYHVLCNPCATDKKVCAKCLQSKEIVAKKEDIRTAADEVREEQELQRLLSRMSVRQKRSYLRKMERGDDLSHIKAEDFEDSDFDFGSDISDDDFSDDDDDEDKEEEQDNDDDEDGEALAKKAKDLKV
ncbi:hypothetical protein BCR43DRAFT_455849 [Syncephalastrum racemosum]|uniref:Uncharacterized protein n=1 Tax=Syncephalastrum racemosum TaxID=13706 RepID=A0A1X2HJN3_SYNRA|nr:hypothetical protein BCR43DRAFT_455849 [Syncephalastrum racemosum]